MADPLVVPDFDPTKEELVDVCHVFAILVKTKCVRPKGITWQERAANTSKEAMQYNVAMFVAAEEAVVVNASADVRYVKRTMHDFFPDDEKVTTIEVRDDE